MAQAVVGAATVAACVVRADAPRQPQRPSAWEAPGSGGEGAGVAVARADAPAAAALRPQQRKRWTHGGWSGDDAI